MTGSKILEKISGGILGGVTGAIPDVINWEILGANSGEITEGWIQKSRSGHIDVLIYKYT